MLNFLKKKEGQQQGSSSLQQKVAPIQKFPMVRINQDKEPRTIRELCQEIQATDIEIGNRNKELEDIVQRCEAARQKNSEISSDIDGSSKVFENYKGINDQIDKKSKEISRIIAIAFSNLGNLDNIIKSLTSQLDLIAKEEAKTMENINTAKSENKDSSNKLSLIQSSIKTIEDSISRLSSENADLTKANSAASLDATSASHLLQQSKQKITEILSKIQQTNQSVSDLKQLSQSLTNSERTVLTEIERRTSEVKDLTACSESISSQIKERLNIATETKNKANELGKRQIGQKLTKLEDQKGSLEEKVSELKRRQKEFKSQIKEAKKETQTATSSSIALYSILQEEMNIKRKMETETTASKARMEAAIGAISKHQADLAALTEELNKEKTKSMEAKTQLITKSADSAQILNDPEYRAANSELNELKIQLDLTKKKRASADELIQQMEDNISTSNNFSSEISAEAAEHSVKAAIPNAKTNKGRSFALD